MNLCSIIFQVENFGNLMVKTFISFVTLQNFPLQLTPKSVSRHAVRTLVSGQV